MNFLMTGPSPPQPSPNINLKSCFSSVRRWSSVTASTLTLNNNIIKFNYSSLIILLCYSFSSMTDKSSFTKIFTSLIESFKLIILVIGVNTSNTTFNNIELITNSIFLNNKLLRIVLFFNQRI